MKRNSFKSSAKKSIAIMYASVSSVSQTLFHIFENIINEFEEQKIVFFVKKCDKSREFVF
jgi:hypothetical protein